MLRRTVDRVASCWNYRFVDEPKSFHEMTPTPPVHLVEPHVLNESLPSKRSGYAEGCNNEALRVLSPLALDEGALGHLTSAEEWSRYAVPALDDALSSLSQCAVVVIERCAETRAVLEHFMPWIAPHFDCSQHLNVGNQERGELSEAAKRVILAHNELDERVYAYGLKQLQMQLQFINASRSSQQPSAPRPQHLASPPRASATPNRPSTRCISRDCIERAKARAEAQAEAKPTMTPTFAQAARPENSAVPAPYDSGYVDAHGDPREIVPGSQRAHVGGLWEEMGTLQFDFLRTHGLLPSSTLLDLGCGALRGGVKFISYLEPGHYYGIDVSPQLMQLGYSTELEPVLQQKLPPANLYATGDYDAAHFGETHFDYMYAISVSLWSQLPLSEIERCLSALRRAMRPGGQYFTSLFVCHGTGCQKSMRHPGGVVTWPNYDTHSIDTIAAVAERLSLKFEYIGNWDHPRSQQMAKFTF